MDSNVYVSPFSERYASKRMQALLSPLDRAKKFRLLWLYLAETEHALGLPVTREQVEEMRAHLEDIDLDRVAALEKELRHDVMAHVHAYGEACPKAMPIIHLGATSCYVGDNADVMIMHEAIRLLQKRMAAVIRTLRGFCLQYKAMPALGFTHFQAAQPTTVGKRAALWLQDIASDLIESEHVLSRLAPLGCKGTTGTQASFLSLFEGNAEKVRALDQMIAEKIGLGEPVPVSGQTYSRKQDYAVLSLLSRIAQSAHKFSNDLRLLQHLKEMEEPFEAHQIGSSAMPYKRNPMRCERMAGLARFLVANVQNAAMTASEQWLERTLDDSANRRLAIAEGFLAADGLLRLYENVTKGLVVYPNMIEKHLRDELPFMASENILMAAVKKGGDRQALHEKIRRHSIQAGKRVKEEGLENDLLQRLRSDPAFPLSEEAFKEALNPAAYTGIAEKQVEWLVQDVIDPLLAEYPEAAGDEETISV